MSCEEATSIENMQSNLSIDIPKENCQREEIPADEIITDEEKEKSNGEEEHDEGYLLVVSVRQIGFSMKLYNSYKDCPTIVVNVLSKTSTSCS